MLGPVFYPGQILFVRVKIWMCIRAKWKTSTWYTDTVPTRTQWGLRVEYLIVLDSFQYLLLRIAYCFSNGCSTSREKVENNANKVRLGKYFWRRSGFRPVQQQWSGTSCQSSMILNHVLTELRSLRFLPLSGGETRVSSIRRWSDFCRLTRRL